MPWYMIVLLACLVVAPFDALYLHIKADRRREALRRGQRTGEMDDREAVARHGDGENHRERKELDT